MTSKFYWSLSVLLLFLIRWVLFLKSKLVFLNSRNTPKFILILLILQACVLKVVKLLEISILKK